MASCSLLIELDESNRVYLPGDRVRGTVIVKADADVQCKALSVNSSWATHGRGNVDSSTAQTEILFQGRWRSGEEYRYPFDLPVASWPPTYHGTYLNVDHYINATADIPWAFDPKASLPFRVHCNAAPESGVPVQTSTANPIANKVVGGCVVVFVLFMLLNPMLWIVAVPVAFVAGGWWFFKTYLPKKLLGRVEYRLDRDRWHPGELLSATLSVHPGRDIAISGVIWTVTAEEVCVSGSGSNRRTHRHELFGGGKVLHDIRRLPGHQETRIPLELQLPDTDCYTMNLGANQIVWHTQVRIDIPRWPDWTEKRTLQLAPRVDSEVTAERVPEGLTAEVSAPGGVNTAPADSSDVTFEATVDMIQKVLEDREQVDRIVEAVHGLPMQVTIIPQRRELYGSGDSEHAYPGGHVVTGHTVDPRMPVTMFIPRSQADEFEQASDRLWTGPGSIVGYDHYQNRLQIRIES